jgi:hypothetical protein
MAERSQVQTKLIDRFGTASELIEFLESPTGKQFLGDMKEAPRHRAHDRILSSIRSAIVLSFLGIGFLSLGIPWDWPGFEIPGAILLALGIGFFVAAFVSTKLSRSWGLIDSPGEREHDVTPSY